MSFNNFDNDFCLIKGNFDPNKFEEFTSTHKQESGQWVPAYDKSNRVYFIDMNPDNIKYNDKKKKWEINTVLIDTSFLGFWPNLGFYYYNTGGDHHVVASISRLFSFRSFRLRIDDNTLNANLNKTVKNISKNEFFGLFGEKTFYPGIPKVFVDDCSENEYVCDLNYPKSTKSLAGTYGIVDKTYLLPTQFNPKFDIHFTGMLFEDQGNIYAEAYLNNFIATLNNSLAINLFCCTVLNDAVSAKKIITQNDLSRDALLDNTCIIRPLAAAHMIGGVRSNEDLNMPLPAWTPMGTLMGLLTELSVMNTENDNLILKQSFQSVFTHITNVFKCPANQETSLAFGSVKVLSLSSYPGYPYFNLIEFDNGIITNYINQPEDSIIDFAFIPYLDDSSLPSLDHTMYTMSIFPEEYAIFEGFAFAKSFIRKVSEGEHHYWYGDKASVIVDTISTSIYIPSKDEGISFELGENTNTLPTEVDCNGLVPYTTNWEKVNKFTEVNYQKSNMNKYEFMSKAVFNEHNTLIGSSFDKPVVMSLSSTKTIDALNERLLSIIKTGDIEELDTLVIPVYLVLQVGDGDKLPENPFQSLNSRRKSIQGHYHYDSNFHIYSSRWGAWRKFIETKTDYEQFIISYDILYNLADIKSFYMPAPEDIKSVEGDLFNGITIKTKKSNDTINVDLSGKTIELETTPITMLYKNVYNGYGVFPTIFMDGTDLIFHTDKELLVYNTETLLIEKSIILPFTDKYTTTILPVKSLEVLYKVLKDRVI